MSDLGRLIANVGDDSTELEKDIFRLYSAAEDLLMAVDRTDHARDRLRRAIPVKESVKACGRGICAKPSGHSGPCDY